MYEILKLNEISPKVTGVLGTDDYVVSSECSSPDAIILRSFNMHDYEVPASVKAVARAGAGVNNIPIDKMTQKGICVFNTPGANANAVKELVFAAIMMVNRNLVEAIDWCKGLAGDPDAAAKVEKGKNQFVGPELAGKTMGVIGYGRIGRLVGEKAQALGMNVLSYVNRHKPEGCECETMHFVTPDEVFAQSDIIVLCAPGAGKPIVDAESLAKMKDGVVIINVSRGANVDEAALLEALNSGKVKAAGLDVWLSEKDPNWALAQHPAVSCTPHIGAGTKEAQKRIGAELVDIIEHFEA